MRYFTTRFQEMNLIEHYNKLYQDAILKIRSENYQIDKLIDAPIDNRFGITLLIRPNDHIKNRIREFLYDLKSAEPHQYYYPDSDIHTTVLAIVTCSDEFRLGQIRLTDYVDVIKRSTSTHKRFEIQFKGITASPSGVMIQGFLNDDTLNSIRDNLRVHFKYSNLKQTIDKRYAIQTAHATVVRFRKQLASPDKFIETLNHYRNFDFGALSVDALELVYNDWYQREKHVKKLYTFELT